MYTVIKCPTNELSLLNCAVINDTNLTDVRHVIVKDNLLFTLKLDSTINDKTIALNAPHRKWANVIEGDRIVVTPCTIDTTNIVKSVIIEVNAYRNKPAYPIDCDSLAIEFKETFANYGLMIGQVFIMYFKTQNHLSLIVKQTDSQTFGLLTRDTAVRFESDSVNLVGKCKQHTSIINRAWNLDQMGIGGLDDKFSDIFRRAFASRLFPHDVIAQIGMKHCRGILLYGPPGTGKTLMARQIAKMLNCREPKIVNGPQIFNKYIGESESNIRNLFIDAEEEEKRMGSNSGLHIIIFDEIDAICKARGSSTNNTNVQDTVVNQLLSKIDGMNSLNNILIIGMTNRKDIIDDALLRPGRLEVQIEIGLPDDHGRVQILRIHTSKMKQNGILDNDVDIDEIASQTQNFSGAELEGLVRAATSIAMNRLVNVSDIDLIGIDNASLRVTMCDFQRALSNDDIIPAFGNRCKNNYIHNGIIIWSERISYIIDDIRLLITQTENTTPLVTILLEGEPGCGKTAMAAYMAYQTNFPFIRFCVPKDMIGYNENAKVQLLKTVFEDAYRSKIACVVLDSIERILDYTDIGPRFSNLVLQTLLVLLNQVPQNGHRILVIVTSSCKSVLKTMQMTSVFTRIINIPNLNTPDHIITCLKQSNVFDDLTSIHPKIPNVSIGIKKLLLLIDTSKQIPEQEKRTIRFLADLSSLSP